MAAQQKHIASNAIGRCAGEWGDVRRHERHWSVRRTFVRLCTDAQEPMMGEGQCGFEAPAATSSEVPGQKTLAESNSPGRKIYLRFIYLFLDDVKF